MQRLRLLTGSQPAASASFAWLLSASAKGLAVFICFVWTAPISSALTITFDDLGLTATTTIGLTPVSVGSGFTMQRSSLDTGTAGIIIFAEPGGSNSFNAGANTGYRYLTAHNSGQELTHTLMRSGGGSFDLASLQYHGWNNNAAPTLIVDAVTSGGGNVSQSFTITNTDTAPFESAVFSAAFQDLTSVTFRSPTGVVGAFQIDDIAVVVPEPSTVGLFTSGLVGLAISGKRRRA